MNLLLKLRETAKWCPDPTIRARLKHTADALALAVVTLRQDTTDLHLQHVNGLWARGKRLIDVAEITPPAPPGGAMTEAAKLAA